MLGASAPIAVAARLTIPLLWVPVTGQTFAALLVAAALGRHRDALAMLVYLADSRAHLTSDDVA